MKGIRQDATRQHPVLDLPYWVEQCPVPTGKVHSSWIDTPRRLALAEQVRSRVVAVTGKEALGPAVTVDVFVWNRGTFDRKKPWLTRIGGVPWRESKAPWPKGKDGWPLTFIGQVCFADSLDLVGNDLPGETMLIFSGVNGQSLDARHAGVHVEWSPRVVAEPAGWGDIPWGGTLSFRLDGVIHRTSQYPSAGNAFERAGLRPLFQDVLQATLIGKLVFFPQGWPFDNIDEADHDASPLIAALSSIIPHGPWPYVNAPRLPQQVTVAGEPYEVGWDELHIEDAGCMWFYRDREGRTRHGSAGG